MEGGSVEAFRLGDIGNYTDVADLYPIGIASLFGINLAIAGARFGNIGGISLNTYFDTFGLEGIMANVALIMIVFQVTRWIYTVGYNSTGSKAWSPFIFICILVAAQFIHDIIFYYGAINVVPSHVNEMLDVLKQYSAQNGKNVIGGHTILMTLIGFMAMVFKEVSVIFRICLIFGIFYAMPYLITMVRYRPPVPEVKVEPKAEPRQETRPDIRHEQRPEPRQETRPDIRQDTRPQPKQEQRKEPQPMNELDAFYSML